MLTFLSDVISAIIGLSLVVKFDLDRNLRLNRNICMFSNSLI
ncbi:hypothetical protein HMPREF0208_03230 [Citrobacter koseri]|nr:hypothetical protein HMPREF3207_01651 [Citrobacter koseri]KXA03953.1 hypothetical protein HMPREF3220_00348 [Citrobacter koseri]KXB42065.1 hypothetical protein HMPREF0208_03230 [Citrobacter koseri]